MCVASHHLKIDRDDHARLAKYVPAGDQPEHGMTAKRRGHAPSIDGSTLECGCA